MRYRSFNTAKLYQDFKNRCKDRGISQEKAADEIGVSRRSAYYLIQGGGSSVHTLALVLLWLGTTDIAPYIMCDEEDEEL